MVIINTVRTTITSIERNFGIWGIGMKKPLLDVMFASEKRKGVLLLLQNGATEMEHLLSALNTTRQALLPQIRILEEHYLIVQQDDTYDLTTIGKLIVEKMTPLLNTIDTLEIDIDYWGNHDFSFIPPHLLERINKIRNSKIMTPHLTEMYDLIKDFYDASKKSRSLNVATLFYHPQFVEMFADLVQLEINVHVIASRDMFDVFKTNASEVFEKLIKSEFFHISVYSKEMNFMSFAVNDYYLRMSPLTSSGDYDNKYILCSDPDSLEWGKEIFEYYLKDSVIVGKI
jgi:predicted transcriptional regulator